MNSFSPLFQKIITLAIFQLVFLFSLSGQIHFDFGSDYSYLKGSDAADIPESWKNVDFDYSAWSIGQAPFRYDNGTGGTVLSDMRYTYSSLYLRSSFTAENIENIKEIEFKTDYDDGFILWLNGEKLISRNAPENPVYNALASADHESGTVEYIKQNSADLTLVEGENTLSIQCFNVLLSSSDFYFDLGIEAQLSLPAVPDTLPVSFSYPSGFYEETFDLILSSPSPEFQIVYTLDGSNPQTSASSVTQSGPVLIPIDPASSAGRPVTPEFMVRASLVKSGFSPSIPVVRNFIFIEALKNQTNPGSGWPTTAVNGQLIDLDMDPDVLNDSRYTAYFDDAMLQIPSICLATDLKNLFNPQTGIYVNAKEHGADWERDCSVELIYPGGSEGFQLNAGLRIRGGNSRNDFNPKHAFRLFFREEYGASKLVYPLFGADGAKEYDKLDLRTAQNYSWSMDGDDHNTFVRDIFSRDSQDDLGNPSTRGDYVHLFLNGMYWGLFQTEERPEARYAASYFGGDKEDYDVIKVAVEDWPYINEATDGTMDAWQELWQLCQQGFSANDDYFALEGKDEKGNPVKNSRVLVDIDNLIDYMLVIFYTGNVDAPVSAWHDNNMPNNYYAIYNRKNKGIGFIFLAHDSEHSMFTHPMYYVHVGLYENRVSIDDPPMSATGIYDFQPQWLHQQLCRNKEYQNRFSDRAYKHLSSAGMLSPQLCSQRFSDRAEEIDMAIIAESARWGDSKVSTPRNKLDDWLPEIEDVLNNLIPYRTDIVIDQLKDVNLYTSLIPPVIVHSGEDIHEDLVFIEGSTPVAIENENNGGTIYYTLSGQDPREVGGTVSASAFSSSGTINLTLNGSALIMARIKSGENWSALKTIAFSLSEENYDMLRVTEVNYHPKDMIVGTDTTNGKDYEFIELKNIGEDAMNISGIKIDSAIRFTVPEGTILPPREFYVIASKPRTFYDYYGRIAHGNFSGNLSNSGEFVLITDPEGNELISFTYLDSEPWPSDADGEGYTLVARDIFPQDDPDDPAYWRKSFYEGGSPFSDDLLVSLNEPLADIANEISLFPNPTSDRMNVKIANTAPGEWLNIRIIDLKGTILLEERLIHGSGLSLANTGIAPGFYLVQIDYSAGTRFEKLIYRK